MLLFMFPFGVLICIWDRKSIADSMRLFNDYIIKMQHADFDNSHKMDRIDTMFYENGYKITRRDTATLVAEKKHFNIGIFFVLAFTIRSHFCSPRRCCIIYFDPRNVLKASSASR